MSAAASQVYARQLLSQKLGYPLFIPEPSANLPAQFRRRGVSIGDVGIIMPNGSFNYVFSVCAAADDPVNYLGVPQGFQRIGLDPNLILQWPDMHKKGSELMSASMKKEDIDASGGLKENEYVKLYNHGHRSPFEIFLLGFCTSPLASAWDIVSRRLAQKLQY